VLGSGSLGEADDLSDPVGLIL